MRIIRTIYFSVFNPSIFSRDIEYKRSNLNLGWILILIRWGYYSILFSFFRDYSGSWKPFVRPPFGLSIKQYSSYQCRFSIFFGLFLMLSIAFVIWSYFKLLRIKVDYFNIFNVLGYTFFLPFVILQPIDLILFNTIGWDLLAFTTTHTIFLIWESVTAVIIISKLVELRLSNKLIANCLIILTWIIICALVWR
jgi:hypothetical protein